jgi:hypothetical protein
MHKVRILYDKYYTSDKIRALYAHPTLHVLHLVQGSASSLNILRLPFHYYLADFSDFSFFNN